MQYCIPDDLIIIDIVVVVDTPEKKLFSDRPGSPDDCQSTAPRYSSSIYCLRY